MRHETCDFANQGKRCKPQIWHLAHNIRVRLHINKIIYQFFNPSWNFKLPGMPNLRPRASLKKADFGSQYQAPSHLQSCSKIPAMILIVDLPVPLSNVLTALSSIDELPMYPTKNQANIALLKSIKHEIKRCVTCTLELWHGKTNY